MFKATLVSLQLVGWRQYLTSWTSDHVASGQALERAGNTALQFFYSNLDICQVLFNGPVTFFELGTPDSCGFQLFRHGTPKLYKTDSLEILEGPQKGRNLFMSFYNGKKCTENCIVSVCVSGLCCFRIFLSRHFNVGTFFLQPPISKMVDMATMIFKIYVGCPSGCQNMILRSIKPNTLLDQLQRHPFFMPPFCRMVGLFHSLVGCSESILL